MSAYSSAVLADAPRHYYRFSDPGGQIARDIGSSPLTLHAGFYLAQLGYTGPVSDGGSAFFTDLGVLWYPHPDLAYAAPLTLECWFYQHFDNGAEMKIVSTENAVTYQGLGIGFAVGRKPECFGFGTAVVAAAAVPLNTWTHIVARHNGASKDLLVNGVLVGSALQAFANGNGPFVVGAQYPNRTLYIEGMVSEVAVYGSALPTARCLAHYNAADQISAFPVYRPNGTQDAGTGAPTFSSDDIAAIYRAVHHTFPTT
jgi:hypothetical protein